MDRDRIERRDFPTGRRGYDPAAVDEHLRRVADEFEARAHAPAPSLADSTSEQVRLILEAAERGAAELHAAASEEAGDHVARVQQAADGMLAKLDALESELTRLMTALRTSGERLAQGLAELQAEATQGLPPTPTHTSPAAADASPPAAAKGSPAAAEGSPAAAEGSSAAADASPPAADVPPADASSPAAADASPPAAAAAPSSGDSAGAPPDRSERPDSPQLSAPDAPDWPPPKGDALFEPPPGDDTLFAAPSEPDEAGARLIALNMALSGSSREDTKAYLAEHFSLPDVEGLLDDVYARAGR